MQLLDQVQEQPLQVEVQQLLMIQPNLQILLELLKRVKIQYQLGQLHLEQLQVERLLQVNQLLVLLKRLQVPQVQELLQQVNLQLLLLRLISLQPLLLKQVVQQGLYMKQARQHLVPMIQLGQQTLQLQRII